MRWFICFLVAALSGLVGLLSAGFAAAGYAQWYHVSTREGAAGFFVIGVAILGGLASFALGCVIALRVSPRFWRAFGWSASLVLGGTGLATLGFYLFADVPPTLDGTELRLEVEICLPASESRPTGEAEFTLGSVVNGVRRSARRGEWKLDQARQENGRWIVPAEAFLFTTRGLRVITVELGDRMVAGFTVPLPARPGLAYQQWSGWLPRPPSGSSQWPDSKPSFRFRVQRIPPPPPPPTQAELEAQEEAAAQAKFDAIAPEAPIGEWIPYTEPGMNERRSALAMDRITSRPGFVREMSVLTLDPVPQHAAEALYFIGRLPQPSGDLLSTVSAAGQDIIVRLRKFNATLPEQDPSFEGAADVGIRFSAWMAAVRSLREKCGGDFIPELREILELSRVRTDSIVVRGDVRRVASYYLREWAGVEPLPGDPPPR